MSAEWRQKRWGSGRDAGQKPHTYMGEEKNCGGEKNRAEESAIGWIATKT